MISAGLPVPDAALAPGRRRDQQQAGHDVGQELLSVGEGEVQMRVLVLVVGHLHARPLHDSVVLLDHGGADHLVPPPGHQVHGHVDEVVVLPQVRRPGGPVGPHVGGGAAVVVHGEPPRPLHLRQVHSDPEREPGHVVHVVVRQAEHADPVGGVAAGDVAHERLDQAPQRGVVVEVPRQLVEEHAEEPGGYVQSRDEVRQERAQEQKQVLRHGEDDGGVLVEARRRHEDQPRQPVGPALDPASDHVHQHRRPAEAVGHRAQFVGLLAADLGAELASQRLQLGDLDSIYLLYDARYVPRSVLIHGILPVPADPRRQRPHLFFLKREDF